MCFWKLINFWGPTPIGLSVLYVLSPSPPCTIMILSRLVSLFLCLLVGCRCPFVAASPVPSQCNHVCGAPPLPSP